jgi:hypothetical protein
VVQEGRMDGEGRKEERVVKEGRKDGEGRKEG